MLVRRRPTWLGGLVSILLLTASVGGCDMPTEPISFETSAKLRAPLLDDEAFRFLGGGEGAYAALIDTTEMDIDSLFFGKRGQDTITVKHAFTVRNTIEANFSSLGPLTDSTENRIVGTTPLRVNYTNGIPLRFDIRVTVVDDSGEAILSIPTEGDDLSLTSAPRADDGTAASAWGGQVRLDLEAKTVRALAQGKALRLRVTGVPGTTGPTPQVQVDDTLQVSLNTEVETALKVGG